MNRHFLISAVFLMAMFVAVFDTQQDSAPPPTEAVPYSDFTRALEDNRVTNIEMSGDRLSGTYANGERFVTVRPWGDTGLVDRIANTDTSIVVKSNQNDVGALDAVLAFAPLIIFVLIALMVVRMLGATMARQMGMGKSRATLMKQDAIKVGFGDVAGIDEVRDELVEIVDFLKNPQKYWSIGAQISKGVLLSGPPGSGKTLLARAVAGEAGVAFYSTSGSDFVEMFVGVGASRVRSMFAEARKNAPCILFIDEIDAVGRRRGSGGGPGNEEREQTLNQMLVEMDGFGERSGVIVIAATNRPDVLDPALLRPGRFDRNITVSNPDAEGREKILGVHTAKVAVANEVDLAQVARGVVGFSGAELANLVNQAALNAARRGARLVGSLDFEHARDRILMGAARTSAAPNRDDLRLTAVHEAGHALAAALQPACDPVHKATILPRGQSLGMVVSLPERDKPTVSLEALEARLTMTMAGRAAEIVVFGPRNVTTGAASDIDQATRIARAMVTTYGMTDGLGTVAYENKAGIEHSPAMEAAVFGEIRKIVEQAMARALALITENRSALNAIAAGLLDREMLTGQDIDRIIAETATTKTTETTAETPIDLTETGMARADEKEAGGVQFASNLK